MSAPAPPASFPVDAAAIGQAHQLYCQLTGQSLRLAFDRERMWYELLRLGYSLRLHSRYGLQGCSATHGGLCHKAPTWTVTGPSRLPATRLTDNYLGGTCTHQ